jgi:hypothetical protein
VVDFQRIFYIELTKDMKKKSMKEIKLDRSEGVIRLIEHSKDFLVIYFTTGMKDSR